MDERSKQRLKWLAGVGLAASPYVGGVIVTAVLLKRVRAGRRRAQQPGYSGSDIGNEVKTLRAPQKLYVYTHL